MQNLAATTSKRGSRHLGCGARARRVFWGSAWALAVGCGAAQGNLDGASAHPTHAHSGPPNPSAAASTQPGDLHGAAGDMQAHASHSSAAVPASSNAPQTSATAHAAGGVSPPAPSSLSADPADPAFSQGPFTGSAACSMCHDGIVDREGHDVSIVEAWSATMMANAARDPLWQAKVESELLRSPEHAELVADKCTRCHAPMAHELSRRDGQALTLQHGGIAETSPYYAAARDGVSCTLCHQIQDTNLGAASSFDGQFQIGAERAIFGPYRDVFTMPMQHMVSYTPQYGAQIQRSELCATCHNVKTPIIDHTGKLIPSDPEQGFAEQAPYSEWSVSAYARTTSCADCHMGRTDGVILSTRPPWLDTARDRFALHGFAGANKLMLNLLDERRDELGVRARGFASTLARTDALLAGAAKIELASSTFQDGTLEFALRVLSMTGHKLPTSFPSRRVVLHVRVTDDRGVVVFESGRIGDDGEIEGLDSEQDLRAVERHHDWIEARNQAQIYESVMQDTRGDVTFTLLRGASYIKDNRILPRGADKGSLPADIAVRGDAEHDADFRAGEDTVHYRVKALPAGRYRVGAALLYQTVSARFARDLFSTQGTAIAWFQQAYSAAAYKTIELTRLEADLR